MLFSISEFDPVTHFLSNRVMEGRVGLIDISALFSPDFVQVIPTTVVRIVESKEICLLFYPGKSISSR